MSHFLTGESFGAALDTALAKLAQPLARPVAEQAADLASRIPDSTEQSALVAAREGEPTAAVGGNEDAAVAGKSRGGTSGFCETAQRGLPKKSNSRRCMACIACFLLVVGIVCV